MAGLTKCGRRPLDRPRPRGTEGQSFDATGTLHRHSLVTAALAARVPAARRAPFAASDRRETP